MRAVFLFLLVCVGHFCVDFFMGVWPVYKSLLGLDLAMAGLIWGLAGFVGDGLQMVTGVLGDQGGRRRYMLLGIALAGCLALCGHLPLFVCVLLMFLGSALFHPNAAAMASELTSRHKGLLMSIFASSGFMGLAVGPRLFAIIFEKVQGEVWILAPLALLLAVAGLLVQYRQKTQGSSLAVQWQECREGLRLQRRPLQFLWLAQACLAALVYGWSFLLPDLLHFKGYSTALAMGGAHFWMIMGSTLVSIPLGFLSDRIGQRPVILGAGLAMILFYYGFLFLPVLPVTVVVPYLFCFGAALGVGNPMIVAFGNRLLPDHAGSVSAFLMGGAWCVGYLGVMAAGFLPSLFEVAPALNALKVLGVLTVIPPLCAFLLPKLAPARSVA